MRASHKCTKPSMLGATCARKMSFGWLPEASWLPHLLPGASSLPSEGQPNIERAWLVCTKMIGNMLTPGLIHVYDPHHSRWGTIE